LRAALPGIQVFDHSYSWDGQTLTIITLEHTAQDLPSPLASIVSIPGPPTWHTEQALRNCIPGNQVSIEFPIPPHLIA
jgi:hypothetical protein